MYQFLDELKVIGEATKDIPNLKQINGAPALNSIIIFSCFMSILQSYGLEVAPISFSAAFLTFSL
jgi:hypothetical protein